MSSDDEWEEQEQICVVELFGILEPDFIQRSEGNCKVLGIGTDKPTLQLDDYTFTGEYTDPLGSCLLFEETEKSENIDKKKSFLVDNKTDETDQDQTQLKYFTSTEKKLMMNRAFITPKKEETKNIPEVTADRDEENSKSNAIENIPDTEAIEGEVTAEEISSVQG